MTMMPVDTNNRRQLGMIGQWVRLPDLDLYGTIVREISRDGEDQYVVFLHDGRREPAYCTVSHDAIQSITPAA